MTPPDDVSAMLSAEDEACFVEVVAGRLFQSGYPVPRDIVEARDVNAVVSVSNSEQDWIEDWMERDAQNLRPGSPQQRIRAQIPLIDATGWLDAPGATAAVDFIYRLLASDDQRRVLVHCDMGAFRSVHVAACVLSRLHNIPPRYAFREIDKKHRGGEARETTGLRDWNEHLDRYGQEE